MGCCSSRLVDQDSNRTTTVHAPCDTAISLPGAYYCENRPFKKTSLMWTSDIPLNRLKLEQKILLYWETALNYGGRIEIWQALQAAFSEPDIIIARSILEAANVLLPTGNPCEGCFDELGHEYQIPIYCVVPPINLSNVSTDEETDQMGSRLISYLISSDNTNNSLSTINHSIYSSTSATLVPAPDCSKNPFFIIVRLSTEQDLQMAISSDKETIGSLKSRIYESSASLNIDSDILRLVYLGRVLQDSMHIICEPVKEVDTEQIFSVKNSIVIAQNTIVQVLVAIKNRNNESIPLLFQ